MKTHTIIGTVALATAFLTTGMLAQTAAPQPPAAPQTTAISPASPMPAPNSIIYVPRLPTPTELSQAAAAQNLSIQKIEQTSSRITVMYQHADGSTTTVAYELLATATAAPAPAPTSTTTVVRSPPARVIYTSPSWYYGGYYDPFWDPWPWYGGPVSVSLGLGYVWGGGGFHHRDFDRGFRHGGFGRRFHRR